ncbi:MAG: MFS transporter [Spirochaetota bacterium]
MKGNDDFRQRLIAISAASVILTLGNTAWDVLGPLWTAGQLHMGSADWAHIRSLRFTGTLVGTLILGFAASTWGPKALGFAFFLIAGCALGFMARGGQAAIYLAIPVFGASISAIYVALNILTQLVGSERQARANAIYRSVGAAIAIAAPISATFLAALIGMVWALVLFACLLALGSLCLILYPAIPADPKRLDFFASLGGILRRPGLVKFICIDQAFALATTGMGVFTALRLSKDFSSPDTLVGIFMTISALSGFVGTISSYQVQQRLGIKRTILLAYVGMMAAWLGFGMAQARGLALASLVLGNLFAGISSAPVSFTVARLGGLGSEASTVTLWKLFQSLAAVLGMNLCAILEPSLGMAGIIAWGSLMAIIPIAILARTRMAMAGQ